jgi:tripartite-type tricarboxylate transporter receptor subunit TctC
MQLGRRAALGGLMATAPGSGARAQAWPSDAMTWIVPSAPGGVNDTFARPVAAHVAATLGQPVVIENKSGAGGTIGAAIAARAPGDGYTMLIANTAHTYAPLIYPQAGFELLRDFAPISAFARVQNALVVNPAVLDVATLQQFIELAKRKPGSIDVGSPGVGSVNHLAIELLEDRAGIQLNHMPYRGSGPAIQDLVGGQIAAIFNPVANLMGYLRSGKLRVLGIAGRRREAMLPDVPTLDEAGLKDFRAVAWTGLFAPKKTPDAVLDRMHGAVQAALVREVTRAVWADQGAKVEPESRAEFASFVGREVERWKVIARAAEIEVE